MKPPAFEYFAPSSVDDALALLDRHGDAARLLAGGQSLLPALNFRLAYPDVLIDLNRIATLATVDLDEDGAFTVGAMTRHRFFETSDLVRQRLPLLHYALPFVAHVQIRNRGTIGGSLCHADPAAEWPALCLACDASMVLQGKHAMRRVGADEFATGLFTTALEPGEILSHIVFPAWPNGRQWGFQELTRRHGDFAIVGVACTVDRDPRGTCTDARVVVFGAADRAVLVPQARQALLGRMPSPQDIRAAAELARAAVPRRADQHASAQYRSELIEVLTARALAQTLDQQWVDRSRDL